MKLTSKVTIAMLEYYRNVIFLKGPIILGVVLLKRGQEIRDCARKNVDDSNDEWSILHDSCEDGNSLEPVSAIHQENKSNGY